MRKNLIPKEYEKFSLGKSIGFCKEVSTPQQIKKEIDKLLKALRDSDISHKNIVVTKVCGRNTYKKTVTMEVQIVIDQLLENLHSVLDSHNYILNNNVIIKAGLMISIPNDMEKFNQAIKAFMKMETNENVQINQYNVQANHIIEVSHIAYDGTVMGFDLYLETGGINNDK
ncbi:hypothetical protein [Candidatus Enterococcus courvalinii]|uniref:Uncharacterized protein n=1 Tax=Candidatus Enterococcus courvalinii TaxID=2815329 RepID=A0ABS3HXS8_9ENTE|nr:hypothetical protein [Enterococcus sp. MSG2901]MBO0481267.1 hypothetical protein [Enterococcus sp. MSG2901]